MDSDVAAADARGRKSIVSELEDKITYFMYGPHASQARRNCHAAGLLCPLWFWTCQNSLQHEQTRQGRMSATATALSLAQSHMHSHDAATASSPNAPRNISSAPAHRELTKACHLVEWLVRSGLPASQIVVILPLMSKSTARTMLTARLRTLLVHPPATEEKDSSSNHANGNDTKEEEAATDSIAHVPALPNILGHHELTAMSARDGRPYRYDVVLYLFGTPPQVDSLPAAMGQEPFIAAALAAAQTAFIFCADAGWTSSTLTTRWPAWRHFVNKWREEQPLVWVGEESTSRTGTSLSNRSIIIDNKNNNGSSNDDAVKKYTNEAESVKKEQSHTTVKTIRAREPDRFLSMIGASLPLCCAQHPQQRQLEYGLTPMISHCKRWCLHRYDCGCEGHICTAKCHFHSDGVRRSTQGNRSNEHAESTGASTGSFHGSGQKSKSHLGCCPYACTRVLDCAAKSAQCAHHVCLFTCGERCRCVEVVERELPCAHYRVIGVDAETGEPVQAQVRHHFRGVCSDAELTCVVEYASVCARCAGQAMVRCADVWQSATSSEGCTTHAMIQPEQCITDTAATARAEADGTLSPNARNDDIAQATKALPDRVGSDNSSPVICAVCRRTEQSMRAVILGEILSQVETQRHKVKTALRRSAFQQNKAAECGLYRPGARVEVVDAMRCVPPLLPDEDFPNIVFADMNDSDFVRRVSGMCGVFVSSHVDEMDRTEVRSLVRLPDGNHVLVSDGGLRMIRGVTLCSDGSHGGGGSNSALCNTLTPLLQLDKSARDSQAGAQLSHSVDESSSALTAPSMSVLGTLAGSPDDAALARRCVGHDMYLSQPTPCSDVAGGSLTHVVVRVLGVDPASSGRVMVCARLSRWVDAAAEHAWGMCEDDSDAGANNSDLLSNTQSQEADKCVHESETRARCTDVVHAETRNASCTTAVSELSQCSVCESESTSSAQANTVNGASIGVKRAVHVRDDVTAAQAPAAEKDEARQMQEKEASTCTGIGTRDGQASLVCQVTTTAPFSAPVASLELLTGLRVGSRVMVSHPERQLREPRVLQAMSAMVQALMSTGMASPHSTNNSTSNYNSNNFKDDNSNDEYTKNSVMFTGSSCVATAVKLWPSFPVTTDVSYYLHGLVNPPQNIPDAARLGPYALLSLLPRKNYTNNSANSSGRTSEVIECVMAVVPWVYLLPDELAEMEEALDAAARAVLERRLGEAVAKEAAERRARHDAEAFQARCDLPRLPHASSPTQRSTTDMDLIAYSTPVPLPTASAVAERKKAAMQHPVGSTVKTRLLHTKDAIAAKQENVQHAAWVSEMHERARRDAEADAMYVRSLQSQHKQLHRVKSAHRS